MSKRAYEQSAIHNFVLDGRLNVVKNILKEGEMESRHGHVSWSMYLPVATGGTR